MTDSDLEDDFEAWMDQMVHINDTEDYKPFPSKNFALLYFLVHGPHPVVSIGVESASLKDLFYEDFFLYPFRETELSC